VELDFHLHRFDWISGPKEFGSKVREVAQRAEAVGVRTLSFMDHYFQMEWIAPAQDPMLEGYTALGYVAGCTTEIRLRLLVTGVTYRHPGLLAKCVTTLDVLSAGRAELGIGAAWYVREHEGLGVPYPPDGERLDRLEEAIQICLQMWSDDDGPYAGRYYQLAETLCRPIPVSTPRPRIIVGGGGERRTLRIVAKYADACNFFGTPEEVAHKVQVLHGHCEAVGRDPAEIEVTAMFRNLPESPSRDEVLTCAEQYAKVGVSTLVVGVTGPDPGGWLEATMGPAIDGLAELQPSIP
jgi:F420-dependent oxidoreductase-like protein